MRMPILIVWGRDGRLVGLLRPFAEVHRWELREEHQEEAALGWLSRGRPGALVLPLGRDLEREMALLARVGWSLPEAFTVVLAEGDFGELASVAWDLSAAFVLTPPRVRDDLPEIVVGLLGGGDEPPVAR